MSYSCIPLVTILGKILLKSNITCFKSFVSGMTILIGAGETINPFTVYHGGAVKTYKGEKKSPLTSKSQHISPSNMEVEPSK